MPVHENEREHYFQWGEHGKKYYYDKNDMMSKEEARLKAVKQGRAIKASQSIR